MPVGDCESAFAAAAAQDGVDLVRARVPWLNQRGHFGLPKHAQIARQALASIFAALGGDPDTQEGKLLTPLPGDFFHEPSRTFIEIDEVQHFTTARLITLDLYPARWPLGFDLSMYREMISLYSPRADRFRSSKTAVAFGVGGRQRQRAYYDALRDLATPAMGYPALIRVPAPDGDGAAAYGRVRDQILKLR